MTGQDKSGRLDNSRACVWSHVIIRGNQLQGMPTHGATTGEIAILALKESYEAMTNTHRSTTSYT